MSDPRTATLAKEIADAAARMARWLRALPEWPSHPVNATGTVSAHFGPTLLSEHDCVLHFARFLADAGLPWEDMHLELSPGQWMYEAQSAARPKRIDLAIMPRDQLAAAPLPAATGALPLDAVFEFALASNFWQHGAGSPRPMLSKVNADVAKVAEYLQLRPGHARVRHGHRGGRSRVPRHVRRGGQGRVRRGGRSAAAMAARLRLLSEQPSSGRLHDMEEVTPNEIARSLGVTGLQFRNWLRAQKDAGHPIVAGHEYRSRYRFTRAEADQLASEFQSGEAPTTTARGTSPQPSDPPQRAARVHPAPEAAANDPLSGLTMSNYPGHRITATWMGEAVTTLADLLRPRSNMVIVGINPSPVSVAAGHYYQGKIGQRFYARLAQAGVIDLAAAGSADDAAYAAGIGFTDVVKRPTSRAHGLRPGELQHGRALLDEKLAALHVPRVLFTFKGGAQALLGTFEGHGLLADRTLAGAEVFVMPGPMERTDRVQLALAHLAEWWAS